MRQIFPSTFPRYPLYRPLLRLVRLPRSPTSISSQETWSQAHACLRFGPLMRRRPRTKVYSSPTLFRCPRRRLSVPFAPRRHPISVQPHVGIRAALSAGKAGSHKRWNVPSAADACDRKSFKSPPRSETVRSSSYSPVHRNVEIVNENLHIDETDAALFWGGSHSWLEREIGGIDSSLLLLLGDFCAQYLRYLSPASFQSSQWEAAVVRLSRLF